MKTEFRDDQFELAYPDGIENHWWYLTRNKIVAQEVQQLTRPDSTVLDVGCGRGVTVKCLRDRGINCVGVELGKARPLAGLGEYVHCDKDAVDLPSTERGRYDTILLLDVIEHVPDPVAFLRTLTEAFPNLTHVLVTVPARTELWSNYDEFYGHYRRYTPEMIKNHSEQLDWELVRSRYFFHSLYPLGRMLVRLGKKRSIEYEAPQGMSKWVHKLISHLLFFDYRGFPSKMPGMSIMACFRLGKRAAGQGAARE